MDTVSINLVGDVMLGEVFENYKRGVLTKISDHGVDPFAYCRSDLQEADVTIGNLECVLSDKTDRPAPMSELLRAPANCVTLLKASGISAVNLANNHTLDHGPEAFQDMISTLARNGICTFGVALKDVAQEEPVPLSVRGLKLGLLGYNLANLPPGEIDSMVTCICGVARRNHARFDLLLASVHWGFEYVDFPPPWVVQQSKRLIEQGIDVVYGHHSHRIQGVARYGDGILAPSLGNFVFDSRFQENRVTGILRLTINGTRKHMAFKVLPYYINRSFQPVPSARWGWELQRRNAVVESMIQAEDLDNERWTKRCRRDSRWGHFKNRVQMRVWFLLRLFRYRPYVGTIVRAKLKGQKLSSRSA